MIYGHKIESSFGRITIIDETKHDRDFPLHIITAGKLEVFKEYIIPSEQKESIHIKDKKMTYYRLKIDYGNTEKKSQKEIENKFKDYVYVAMLTDHDQNLTTRSTTTKRKYADFDTQSKIRQFFLILSLFFNLFFVIQSSLSPSDQFVIRLDEWSDIGWILFIISMIKLVDFTQETDAAMSDIFVRYWGKIYNPNLDEDVEVAFCTMHSSSKIWISKIEAEQVEKEHIQAHAAIAKEADAKMHAEINQSRAKDIRIKDQAEQLKDAEDRVERNKKRAYAQGLQDESAEVSKASDVVDTYYRFENPIKYFGFGILIVSIIMFLRALTKSLPDSTDIEFVVAINEIPLMAWFIFGIIIFFVLRWTYSLFGAFK